jgi:hypothetical protein
MKALLWFYVRSGVRVAMRISALTFATVAGWITIQDSPQAFIAALARGTFARRPDTWLVVEIGGLAFVMALFGAVRLRASARGWIRHLPFSEAEHRKGLLVALECAQLPLVIALSVLAILAHVQGVAIVRAAIGWAFVVIAAAIAALPVAIARATRRRWVSGPHWMPQWLLQWRIAWRALGGRILLAYALGLLLLAAGWLLVTNNDLAPAQAAGAWRLAGSLACVACLFSLSTQLAIRRPTWALARSFPWSARRRVIEDSVFLMGHTLPIGLGVLVEAPRSRSFMSILAILALLPFLAVRAAGHMRRIPERQTANQLERMALLDSLATAARIASTTI